MLRYCTQQCELGDEKETSIQIQAETALPNINSDSCSITGVSVCTLSSIKIVKYATLLGKRSNNPEIRDFLCVINRNFRGNCSRARGDKDDNFMPNTCKFCDF